MTIGEKLKEARQQFGWSQEELAKKIFVSRAAIAKWEADNGIPDMSNLKAISNLLQVSVDYLLDNNATVIKYVIKEPINLKDYGKGIKKRKCNRAIRTRFPNAEIRPLIPRQKLTKAEKVIDNVIGFTFGSFGIPDIINAFKLTGEYYLVRNNGQEYLAMVADTYMEIQELAFRVTEKKFEFGDFLFTVCNYCVKD